MQQGSRGDNAMYYHVVKIANRKDVAALARERLIAVVCSVDGKRLAPLHLVLRGESNRIALP